MSLRIEPNPVENILKSGPLSPMLFMSEHLIYDSQQGGLVRFRGLFEMPDWEGVEADEMTYIVSDANDRIDRIAKAAWGESRVSMCWIIAARNNLDLPDVQLHKGRVLKIPSKNWIDTRLFPQSSGIGGR